MRSRSYVFLGLLLALGLAACASGGGGTGTRPVDSNVITLLEIQQVRADNAYEIVRQLRPRWLRARGSRGFRSAGGADTASAPAGSLETGASLVVYLDEVMLGAPSELERISAQQVRSIRFLDASDAQQRFGMNHVQGAIVVSTR